MVFTTRNTGVWAQFLPGGDKFFLGHCIDWDSLPNPRSGGIETIYCWNALRNGHDAKGRRISPPDNLEFTISHLTEATANWLETVECTFNLYALFSESIPETWSNWERAACVANCEIIDDPIAEVAHHQDDNDVMHEYNVATSPPRYDFFRSDIVTRNYGASDAVGALALADGPSCRYPFRDACQKWGLSVATDPENIYLSDDNGATWTQTAADPFAAGVDVGAMVIINRGDYDVIICVADPGVGLCAVATSIDEGATWTSYTIPGTTAQGVQNPHALFALDERHIWVGLDDGEIYFSDDLGATWSAQGATGATGGQAINGINMVGGGIGWACCDTGVVIKTNNGEDWTATAAVPHASNMNDIQGFNTYRAIVGSVSNGLWITFDEGASWTNITNGIVVGNVVSISFVNDFYGVVVSQPGAAGNMFVYETIDGGNEFEIMTTPTSTGIVQIEACSNGQSMLVGAAGLVASQVLRTQG